MATSSITRSAAATPPLDHALSSVRVAAYDLVGPVASCFAKAAAVAARSFSGTTCVAIPSSPASRTAIRKASAKRRSSRLKGGLASTMFPIAPSRSNRIVVIVALLLWPTSGRALIGGSRDDGQQQMRWPLGIPVDPVGHGLAAANVVWNVFDVGHRAGAGRYIHRGDVETDAVSRLELVCRGEDLYLVLDHFPRLHRRNRILRQPVERLPGLGALLVKRPVGCLQPTACQLALRQ